MVAIHALGDSGACLNGDGLSRGAWFCHRTEPALWYSNYGCHSGDSPRCLPTPTHHEAGIQENRGYCFNLDFDHLGYLCLPGSLV